MADGRHHENGKIGHISGRLIDLHQIWNDYAYYLQRINERQLPNVKILVLSHPLGDLGVTYTVHLWLDGKRVVDFQLAIIEFFSLALTAASLLSEICRNRRF